MLALGRIHKIMLRKDKHTGTWTYEVSTTKLFLGHFEHLRELGPVCDICLLKYGSRST